MTTPIPLLQYWHDGDPPPGVRRRMAGWAEDPDFDVTVHDDGSAAEFLRQHFDRDTLRAFDSCAVPAMRADFFRYAWLLVHGGAYVDADVKNLGGAGAVFRATDRGCLFLRDADKRAMGEGWRAGRIPNGFLYVRNPRDPALAYVLEQATENVTQQISNDVWEVTGPGIMTAVWGEGGTRSDDFFDGFTIHAFEDVAERVAGFGHMGFKNRDTYWRKYRDPSHGSIYQAPEAGAGADDLLLPPGSRLLHIGPHKTGTTAIQVSLQKSRRRLAEHGVRYVGINRARRAAWAIGVRGAPGVLARQPEKRWHDLVADLHDDPSPRACISNEDFGRAEPPQVRRIADELGGREPHVVTVVRRLDKLLPSLWQQRVKVGSPLDYDAWLRIVLDRPGEPATWDDPTSSQHTERTNVWYAHDVGALVRRWADVVGPERITLIVTDDSDRELLPRTFERMLGLPTDLLALYPDESNRSLPWGEVEFIRAINEALIARGIPQHERRRLVARGLVPDLMARPAADRSRSSPPLPAWAAPVVQELNDARVDAIGTLGVRIVGDPDSLRVSGIPAGDASAPPALPGATAAHAIDWLIGELERDPPGTPAAEQPSGPRARSRPRKWMSRRH